MIDRTPPHDHEAEQVVIGTCLAAGRIPRQAEYLTGREFYRPAHETVWQAMQHLASEGKPCDPVMLGGYLRQLGMTREIGHDVYLAELFAASRPLDSLAHYIERVLERHQRRNIIEVSQRAIEQSFESGQSAEDIAATLESSVLGAVPDRRVAETLDLEQFLTQALPSRHWVVPGLLTRGDRLVLTGLEGLGKSVVMRQILVCAAASMHPFTGDDAFPASSLLVDCENPTRIMVNSFQRLADAVRTHGREVDSRRLKIHRRPEGIDLAQPSERLWLQRLVERHKPDILAIGPAYKMHMGGSNSREEDLARQVASTLDSIREQVGCAVILEHHSPHGAPGVKHRSVRPIGSSLWLRWPEFGIGICYADEPDAVENRIVDLQHWRGAREERDWPLQLKSSGKGMPWVQTENGYRP